MAAVVAKPEPGPKPLETVHHVVNWLEWGLRFNGRH